MNEDYKETIIKPQPLIRHSSLTLVSQDEQFEKSSISYFDRLKFFDFNLMDLDKEDISIDSEVFRHLFSIKIGDEQNHQYSSNDFFVINRDQYDNVVLTKKFGYPSLVNLPKPGMSKIRTPCFTFDLDFQQGIKTIGFRFISNKAITNLVGYKYRTQGMSPGIYGNNNNNYNIIPNKEYYFEFMIGKEPNNDGTCIITFLMHFIDNNNNEVTTTSSNLGKFTDVKILDNLINISDIENPPIIQITDIYQCFRLEYHNYYVNKGLGPIRLHNVKLDQANGVTHYYKSKLLIDGKILENIKYSDIVNTLNKPLESVYKQGTGLTYLRYKEDIKTDKPTEDESSIDILIKNATKLKYDKKYIENIESTRHGDEYSYYYGNVFFAQFNVILDNNSNKNYKLFINHSSYTYNYEDDDYDDHDNFHYHGHQGVYNDNNGEDYKINYKYTYFIVNDYINSLEYTHLNTNSLLDYSIILK